MAGSADVGCCSGIGDVIGIVGSGAPPGFDQLKVGVLSTGGARGSGAVGIGLGVDNGAEVPLEVKSEGGVFDSGGSGFTDPILNEGADG